MATKLVWKGDGLDKMERAIAVLGSEEAARTAYRSVLNARGSLLRKDAVRILPRQTGLAKETISKALGRAVRASNNSLAYILTTRGGFISLKYFGPKEGNGGVTAYPRHDAKFVNSGFITGGLMGQRQALPLGDHVYAPNGKTAGKKSKYQGANGNQWGRGIDKEVSDVRIPEEMVIDDMAAAAEKHARLLEPDLQARIKKMTGNIF